LNLLGGELVLRYDRLSEIVAALQRLHEHDQLLDLAQRIAA